MINQNSLSQLIPNKSPWNYPHTKVIRVPSNIADEVLMFAHKIDSKESENIEIKSTVTVDKLRLLLAKIESKESGYKANSATKLIKDLQSILIEEKDQAN